LLVAQSPAPAFRVSFPGEKWAVEIQAPGFLVTQNETQQDGRRYLLALNEKSGVDLSITLEKVSKSATLEGCKQEFEIRIQPDGPFRLTGIKQSEAGGMPVLQYMIREFNGAPIEQENMFGCMAREHMYVDLHVSKAGFQDADEPQMLDLLKNAKIVDLSGSDETNTLPAGAIAFFIEGSRHFDLQEFDQAIVPYRRALDLEKQHRSLDDAKWHTLIDNLAMAYGISGDLDASQRIVEYGISEDSAYPMFYFILADDFAERDDLLNTMKNLRLALKYKANILAGEKLPKPLADDAFKRFWGNEEFMQLADQFK